MKIPAAQIPAGVLLSTTLVTVAVLPTGAQDPPASVVQPRAPGQQTRTLTATAAEVRMTVFNAQQQPRVVWEPTVTVARAYLDHDAIRADRTTSISGALDRFERLEGVPGQPAVLTELEQAAIELERESRVSVLGERPTDRSRLRSLGATLRGLAGSIR
jgi:hypothetical protein